MRERSRSEETIEKIRQTMYLVTGGKWPAIKPYAQFFMSPSEAQHALLLQKGRFLPWQSIDTMLSRKRKAGIEVVDLTKEERTDIKRRNSRVTREEVERRVKLWLEARDFLQEEGIDTSFFRRGHWMAMIDLARKPLILADPKNFYQVQVVSYTRDWLEFRERQRQLALIPAPLPLKLEDDLRQQELPLDEEMNPARHPAQSSFTDSRPQRVSQYLTYQLGLTLPVEDDDLIHPASIMAKEMAMSTKDVAGGISGLRLIGLLPRPRPENTKRRTTVSVSLARGGKWLQIERYAPLMYPREVLLALIEQLGEDEVKKRGLHRDNIARSITKHGLTKYQRKGLKDLSPEQRQDTLSFAHESDDSRRGRVKFWLKVMDLLDKQGIKHPADREVWMDIWQRAKTKEEALAIILPQDPLATAGTMVKLTSGQIGCVEGEVIEDGTSYIKVRLLPEQNSFKYIPKAIMDKRAELISQESQG